MALLFCDSFDHYASGDATTKYNQVQTNNGFTIGAAAGRNGTNGLQTGGNDSWARKTGLNAHATYICGFAFKPASLADNSGAFFQLEDPSQIAHIMLRINGQHIQALRGDGTVLGTSTQTLVINQSHYVEIKVLCSDTVGTLEVRVNGVVWLSLTGIDTRNGGTATFGGIIFGGVGNVNGATYNFDDLYVCDGSGATNLDFLGDVRIQAILPSGDGNSSVLLGSDGNSVNNSLLVDEATPNSDTDYVSSAVVGDKDTYAFGNVTPVSGTVYGVQVLPFARKDDAGVRSIVSVARVSATEVDGPAQALTTTYKYYADVRETKPGGGAWTITDVNAAEFGVKVNA